MKRVPELALPPVNIPNSGSTAKKPPISAKRIIGKSGEVRRHFTLDPEVLVTGRNQHIRLLSHHIPVTNFIAHRALEKDSLRQRPVGSVHRRREGVCRKPSLKACVLLGSLPIGARVPMN